MKFEILNRLSGDVQLTAEIDDSGNKAINIGLAVKWGIDNDADLRSADLSSANLRSADLRYADLRFANLRSADLSSANLRSADLRSANLSRADLSSANLRYADLSSADLSSANLHSADLGYADLRYANLSSANLRSADLIVLMLPIWTVYITKEHAAIGCQYNTHEEWASYTDEQISEMDSEALEWWKRHKLIVMAGIDAVKDQSDG